MDRGTDADREQQPWFVAVGASGAGGLDDIQELLRALPPLPGIVLLVVLHRPFDRASHLQSILAHASGWPVVVAEEGARLEPGTCYIGEPAAHLTLVARSFGHLIRDPGHRYRNRTVDVLFRSVAEHGAKRTIGVILSGSLDDGSRGLAAIHDAGGLTMVLTPHSKGFVGMPENAIRYDGPVDFIGTPRQIAATISRVVAGDRAPAGQSPTG